MKKVLKILGITLLSIIGILLIGLVNILSDCITSYDKKKINEMLQYYESKGSKMISLNVLLGSK